MLDDLLAINEDGLWTHTKLGYSVPRRNGKNEIVLMIELFDLMNGEQVLHTATENVVISRLEKKEMLKNEIKNTLNP